MIEQTKIHSLFKSSKNIDYIQKGKKRQAEISSSESTFLISTNCNKRIKLLSGQEKKEEEEKEEALASKSTLCASNPQSPSNIFNLSSKTKNVLDKILLKKDKESKPLSQCQSSIVTFLQSRQKAKENEQRFSIESSQSNKNNKKKPKELSSKAQQIILQLKQEKLDRLNRFNRSPLPTHTRSDSSFSLRFKYEELLSNNRELPLPIKYKSLFTSFMAMEQSLNLFKLSSCEKVPTFKAIKETVEHFSYKKFDMKILQQILYVVPHLYIYKYEQLGNEKEYQMIIDIPYDHKDRIARNDLGIDFDFNTLQMPIEGFKSISGPIAQCDTIQRRELFKNVLLEFVNDSHKKFLKDNKLVVFNPFKVKTWHHDFDSASCVDIPTFEIQPKPDSKSKLFSYEDAIRNNYIKERLVLEALTQMNNNTSFAIKTKIEEKENESEKIDKDHEQLKKIVSEDFINRLKAKESAMKLSKEILEHNYAKNKISSRMTEIKEIMMQMKTLYVINEGKKDSFEIGNLAEILLTSSSFLKKHSSIDSITDILFKLNKNYGSIIKMKEHSFLGRVVMMDTKWQIPDEISIEDY